MEKTGGNSNPETKRVLPMIPVLNFISTNELGYGCGFTGTFSEIGIIGIILGLADERILVE